MGAGGVIVPPRGYFEKIQAVLRSYDVLLIADEVICGFGRTGNYWGSQTFGIEPDILTCAKALSSAYLPISAVMVNERVFQALAGESHEIGTFGHGYTYSGHPVPAAVAIETLKIYDEMDIVGSARASAPHMQAELRRRFAGHRAGGRGARRRPDRRAWSWWPTGPPAELRPGGQGRRPAGQAVRGARRDRPRAAERRAGVQPAADHDRGRGGRDAGRGGAGARRADGAAAAGAPGGACEAPAAVSWPG